MTPPPQPPPSRPLTNSSTLLLTTPALLILLICSISPLLWMAITLLANPTVRSEFSLDAFRLHLLARTLLYNGGAALIAAAMGLPAGFVLGRGRGPLARAMWVILPAALLMPSLSYAYGWSQFVRLIEPHVPINFRPTGPADVFRCIWSLGTWLWAVPAGLIGLTLRRLDSTLQQQALLDGALRRITLRQLAGPIIASIAIVTILATQEFAVYEPTGISVVATEVRMVFDTGAISSPDNSIMGAISSGTGLRAPDQAARAAAAVATALPLLLITALLAAIAAWAATRSSASDALAVGDWPRCVDASRWTLALTLLFVCINVGIPIASLIGSLRVNFDMIRIWREFGPQVQGAIIVATEAATVALLAAFSSAGRWLRGSLAIAAASFLIGGQLLAIALIRIYNRPGLNWAYDISVVPVIAYVGRFGWIALSAGHATWSRPWRDLREVAAVDGANPFQTAISIIFPLAWPTLLAAGLLVGTLSLTEVPATVLLMPQNPQVLTPTLMTWVHMARFDPMIEASLLMMAAVLIPAVSAIALTRIGLRVAAALTPRYSEASTPSDSKSP